MSLAYKYIKDIHVAKHDFCLSEPEYRKILLKIGQAKSCTELTEDTAKEVIKEIKSSQAHRKGWQVGQIKMFLRYQRFAKMQELEARAILHEVTGIMHENSPALTQTQFEHTMAALETRLDEEIIAGRVALPKGIQIEYWRNRLPGKMATSRQLWEIRQTWQELQGYLPEEKRNDSYFQGIISQACGYKAGNNRMTVFVAKSIIDALKRMLKQKKEELEKQVPF